MKLFFFKIFLLSICFCKLAFSELQGQDQLDSLEKELPNLPIDSAKVEYIADLAFQYRYFDPDKGIKLASDAYNLSRAISWKQGEAYAFNSLGVNYKSKSEYDKALEYYQKSADINKLLGNKRNLSYNYGNIGIIHIILGNYEKSIQYQNKSLEIKKELKDSTGIASSLINIGIIYEDKAQYALALKTFQEALEIEERLGEESAISTILFHIANIYNYQNDPIKALEYYNKVLEIDRKMGSDYQIAITLGTIGTVYEQNSQPDKALEYYNESLKLSKKANNKKALATNFANIGILYKNQKNYLSALIHLKKALKVNKEIKNKRGYAHATGAISEVYYMLATDKQSTQESKEKFAKLDEDSFISDAIQYSKEAIKIYKELGEINLQSNQWEFLSEIYTYQNQFKKAFEAYKNYTSLKDSIFNQEKIEKIQELTLEREKLEKEKELAIFKAKTEAENKEKYLVLELILGGFVLISILSYIIYRLLKKDKSLNSTFLKTNSELLEKTKDENKQIRFAKGLQSSVLPQRSTLENYLGSYSLLFLPKEELSGDFFWFKIVGSNYFLAIGDCGLSGIKGAMLSVMAINFLDEAVLNKKIERTGEILSYLNSQLFEKVDSNDLDGGIEIALIKVPIKLKMMQDVNKNFQIQFSAAIRPLIVCNQTDEYIKIKGDKNYILEGRHSDKNFQYSTQIIGLKENSKLILTTDGIIDQLDINDRKFGTKRFTNLIKNNHLESADRILQELRNEIERHKSGLPLDDDITVMIIEV